MNSNKYKEKLELISTMAFLCCIVAIALVGIIFLVVSIPELLKFVLREAIPLFFCFSPLFIWHRLCEASEHTRNPLRKTDNWDRFYLYIVNRLKRLTPKTLYCPLKNLYKKYAFYLAVIGYIAFLYYGFTFMGSFWNYFGEEKPGAYFEKQEYKTYLYVNVFPDSEDSKNYRIPALVHATYDLSLYDDNLYRCYYITSLELPTKYIVEFSNKQCLVLGSIEWIVDDEERRWGIELTAKPKR